MYGGAGGHRKPTLNMRGFRGGAPVRTQDTISYIRVLGIELIEFNHSGLFGVVG
jgi:hypothetical protein